MFLLSILSGAALLLSVPAPLTEPPAEPRMQTLQLVEAATPEGEQKVLPGTIIAKAAIARLDAAILAHDVVLNGKRVIARGTVLRAELDDAGAKATIKIFCQPPSAIPVGKPEPPQDGARYCLFDANSDGKFDHAFPFGAKSKPVVIAPTDFGRIEGRPLGTTSVAQLRYLGAVQGSDTLAFALEAYLSGWKSDVPHPRAVISVAKLPAYGVVGTAVVTVLAYDRKTQIATLRMDHGLAPGHIEVPEPMRGY